MIESIDLNDYDRWLHKVANGILPPNHPDHDDLVQEGRIAMWKAAQKHNPELGALPPWVTKAAVDRMRTMAWGRGKPTGHEVQRGRASVEADISLDDLAVDVQQDAPDLADSIALAYHHGEIMDALDHLTPDQRRYIVLRFWGGVEPNSQDPVIKEIRKSEPAFSAGRRKARRAAELQLAEELEALKESRNTYGQ